MNRNVDRDAAVRQLVPINRLPPENQAALLASSEFQPVFDGQFVYLQGHRDNYVHYLVDGTVEFLWNDSSVSRLEAGSKAARRALDTPGRKRQTVRAISNCTVLRIPRAEYDAQLEEGNLLTGPQQVEVSEIAAEKSSNWMIKMLQSELFTKLPATNIQKIFGRMEQITVESDEIIVKQGGIGDYYYVIERGYCEVSRQIQGGKEIHLADLGPGEAFGEAALIADDERNASVTMLSEGTLMRLSRDDFNELLREPLLRGVSANSAITQIDRGAHWLDIRYPEEHASSIPARAQNIPFNILRLQANRLNKRQRYVVCSDDPTQSAVGAFLLLERGLSVVYLDDKISALLSEHPSMLAILADKQRPSTMAQLSVDDPKRSGKLEPTSPSTEETAMDDRQSDNNQFENTIDKIDRLYSQKEWEEEKAARVPQADYAHTVTGQRLADLIDQIDETGETLGSESDAQVGEAVPQVRLDQVIDIAPDAKTPTSGSSSDVLLVDTRAPLPVSADETLHDELFEDDDNESLSQIIHDFEFKLRDHVETVARKRTEGVQQRYQDKLKRIRKAAALEVRKRQELSRKRYALQYKKKELQLRAHYKKLMALANKISEQKSQLQQAKKQFEDKLSAANAVYKQVEDMRKSLRQHIDDLPPSSESERRRSA